MHCSAVLHALTPLVKPQQLQAMCLGLLLHHCDATASAHSMQGPGVPVMPCRAGTNIGGGTFWGLCKLLTGMDNFDDILSLSSQGDNSNVGGLSTAV